MLLLFTAFQSCRKDEVKDDIVIVTPTGSDGESNLTIYVTDEDQQPVSDALVTIRSTSKRTDENGMVRIPKVKHDSNGELVTVAQESYFKSYKRLQPNNSQSNFMQVSMIAKTAEDGSFASGAGGVVKDGNSNAQVEFSPNSFVLDGTSTEYTGEVKVYLHHFSPTDMSIVESMPGNLHGLDLEGNEVQLATMGMLMVELEGQNGQKLNLNTNETATISLPVPNSLMDVAPSQIPLWAMDESTGLWIEESSADLVDDRYVGVVEHFSFWNCDVPYPLVTLSGTLLSTQGTPLSYEQVIINTPNNLMTGYGYTNEQGYFSGNVPANEDLILYTRDNCGSLSTPISISPLSVDTDLGPITIQLIDETQVTGSFFDCDQNILEEGYLIIEYGQNQSIVLPITNGTINRAITICQVSSVQVTVVDFANLKQSEPTTFQVSGSTLDLGMISLCEELDEFITGQLGSRTVSFTSPEAVIQGSQLVISAYTPEIGFSTRLDGRTVGSQDAEYLVLNTNTNDLAAACGQLAGEECQGILSVEITKIGGLGEIIEGTITGQAYEENNLVDVDLQFKVNLDDIQEYISGKIWLDSNENGLLDNGERGLSDISLRLENAGLNSTFRTKADGLYETLVSTTDNFTLSFINNPYLHSPQDQGSDDNIDSDFDQNSGEISGIMTLGNPLVIDGGLYFSSNSGVCNIIGIGPNCDAALGKIYVGVDNVPQGTSFAITYDGDFGEFPTTITTSSNPSYLSGMPPGLEVEVTVIYNGFSCTEDIIIPDVSPLIVSTTIVTKDCENNTGDIIIEEDPHPFTNWYSYQWSNGSTSKDLIDVMAGTYALTITDADGCIQEETITALFDDSSKSIGGFVWSDRGTNADVYDQLDVALAGINVRLLNEVGDIIDTQQTTQEGYQFSNLAEGIYYIEVEPTGNANSLVAKDAGNDDDIDSDGDPATFRTDAITVTSGCFKLDNVSFGFE